MECGRGVLMSFLNLKIAGSWIEVGMRWAKQLLLSLKYSNELIWFLVPLWLAGLRDVPAAIEASFCYDSSTLILGKADPKLFKGILPSSSLVEWCSCDFMHFLT